MYTLAVIFSLVLSAVFLILFVLFKVVKVNWPQTSSDKKLEEYQDSSALLAKKTSEIEKEREILYQQINSNLRKEDLLEKRLADCRQKLSEISNMSEEDARQKLFENIHEEFRKELDIFSNKQLRVLKEDLQSKTTKIISSAIERYSSQLVFSKTTDCLIVDDKKTVSRIIGKDGRNITLFRKLTGTDIIIDKERSEKDKKNNSGIVVTISSFNSLRREIALQTLKKLIQNEQKITPLYIEKLFDETSDEIDFLIFKTGESVLEELQITNISRDLTELLGRLKYRTSYGQNVLEHSLEVAKISGTIAAEIGLDPTLAKRAGLLHDIGKAAEDVTGSSHVTSGILIAQDHNESDIVINAIASHHDRALANNPYSLIVAAADTISAARPGARGNQTDSYVLRMKGIEEIAGEFEGVKKIYSFQAGREIWAIIDANKVTDLQCIELAKMIRNRIKEKVIIPGDITLSVVKEKKIVEKIVNSGRG